jgi:hypothetical protein
VSIPWFNVSDPRVRLQLRELRRERRTIIHGVSSNRAKGGHGRGIVGYPRFGKPHALRFRGKRHKTRVAA